MGHVLLFFLAFAFAHQDLVHSQQCSAEGNLLLTLQFADVGADQRIPAQHQPPGPLDPLYHLVHNYLDVVQQNPFPTELLKDVLTEPPTATTSQILRYQAGYVICAAIAVLYFVTVPLVGLSLCCFQRNWHCGGRIKAYRRSLLCQRNLLMVCLLLTTLLILWSIGSTIHFLLKETVSSAMASLKGRVQEFPAPLAYDPRVCPGPDLGPGRAGIDAEGSEAKPHFSPGRAPLHVLHGGPQQSSGFEVPSVEKVLKNLHGLPQTNFSEMIHKANNSFNAIPQFTVMKMDKVVQELKKDIERAGQKVQFVADDFPISDQTRPMNEALAKAENMSRPFLKEVKPFETYSGVTLSFLFSWFLILLVTGTFLIGGNIQTLVCKPWANQEIFRCKNGAGLWEVLQLKDQYSLSEHLSVAKYTAEFQERLRAINFHFEDIVLLNAEGRRDLETFRKSQVDLVNYADFTAESDRTLAGRLVEEAQKLRRIQNQIVLPMEALMAQLKESVQFLATMSPSFQAQFNNTESQITLVEAILPLQTQKILRQELDCFVRKELGYISQYLNWMRTTLTEDVASCQPFSTALDNGRVILCNRILDPWNAFWFSLGGCAFFLLPGIFLALKMMKHFRPIRHKLMKRFPSTSHGSRLCGCKASLTAPPDAQVLLPELQNRQRVDGQDCFQETFAKGPLPVTLAEIRGKK
ncbi:Prominin-2, partial [Ophiophagus hannah]